MTGITNEVQVFTFRDGLLSRLGHDLRFRLARFTLQVEGDVVVGRFDVASMELDGAMINGALSPTVLNERDRRDILDNLHQKVLRTHGNRPPELTCSLAALRTTTPATLNAELTLCGAKRSIELKLSEREGVVRGQVELTPSRFGIAPFKALLGALRLQDRVLVTFQLQLDAIAGIQGIRG